MSSSYSAVSIIFNPKSTGTSKINAENLRRTLAKDIPHIPIRLIPTRHAGHASELAYTEALASKYPLIISASGDGGYNEVVNGVMRAQAEGAAVATGLLPSGNANDHYRSLRSGTVEKHIATGYQRSIDLLHITATKGDQSWERYAHSYIGIGITANVGLQLNQMDLNPINELLVSARTIYNSAPATVLVDGKTRHYDSLIFSNVSRLAKIFILSSKSQIDDGKFEVIALQSKNKAAMLRRVVQALTSPAENVVGVRQRSSFSFQTTDKQAMQFDGETTSLEPGTTVTIHSEKQVLRCVI
jgi:diacylglycerol kinase (ATP)